jgi:hypothetical protein
LKEKGNFNGSNVGSATPPPQLYFPAAAFHHSGYNK